MFKVKNPFNHRCIPLGLDIRYYYTIRASSYINGIIQARSVGRDAFSDYTQNVGFRVCLKIK